MFFGARPSILLLPAPKEEVGGRGEGKGDHAAPRTPPPPRNARCTIRPRAKLPNSQTGPASLDAARWPDNKLPDGRRRPTDLGNWSLLLSYRSRSSVFRYERVSLQQVIGYESTVMSV